MRRRRLRIRVDVEAEECGGVVDPDGFVVHELACHEQAFAPRARYSQTNVITDADFDLSAVAGGLEDMLVDLQPEFCG
jgi:hypothetical protein